LPSSASARSRSRRCARKRRFDAVCPISTAARRKAPPRLRGRALAFDCNQEPRPDERCAAAGLKQSFMRNSPALKGGGQSRLGLTTQSRSSPRRNSFLLVPRCLGGDLRAAAAGFGDAAQTGLTTKAPTHREEGRNRAFRAAIILLRVLRASVVHRASVGSAANAVASPQRLSRRRGISSRSGSASIWTERSLTPAGARD
jgi:hypothetical protein